MASEYRTAGGSAPHAEIGSERETRQRTLSVKKGEASSEPRHQSNGRRGISRRRKEGVISVTAAGSGRNGALVDIQLDKT